MRYLRGRYRIVSVGRLCRELLDGVRVPPTLAITFDDGYRDLYTNAFPILKKYELPATIYLIGRCMETGEVPWYDKIFASIAAAKYDSLEVETNGVRLFSLSTLAKRLEAAWDIVCYLRSISDEARKRWCTEFDRKVSPPDHLLEGRMLNWCQIRAMQRFGISFGAHTMNHPVLSQLDSNNYQDECVLSKQLLERGLGERVEDFAYPFGRPTDGSKDVQEYLVRAGYRSAVTTIEGFNSTGDNLYMLRRLQINDDCSVPLFAFNVSRMFFEVNPKLPAAWSSLMPNQSAAVRESGQDFS
jgi:peptidoglycan/xylan/chitin deacetylase (PgdA/CDA1 family)